MSELNDFIGRLANPFDVAKPPVTAGPDGAVLDASGRTIGQWEPDARLVDWRWPEYCQDKGLVAFAMAERETWDTWAEGDLKSRNLSSMTALPTLDIWNRKYPVVAKALAQAKSEFDLAGARMLDIGGSFKDSPYFLSAGVGTIDQVEVSRASQATALAKVASVEEATGEALRHRIVFHNIPAEHLPFQDGAFDIVFSRATIHHCQRPQVFNEMARVLKPGGLMLLVERYLSDPLYGAMKVWRNVRRVDRGSDDPIRVYQLEEASGLFKQFAWVPFGAEKVPAYFAQKLGGRGPDHGFDASGPAWINRWFGTEVAVAARR